MNKIHHLSFPRSNSRTYLPLQLVHTDVWGPSPITSPQGFKYYSYFVGN